MTLKTTLSVLCLCLPLAAGASINPANVAAEIQTTIDQGVYPSWWDVTLPSEVVPQVEGKVKRLMGAIDETDDARRERVAAVIRQHFSRVWAWRQEVDARLDAAWADWDAARDNTNGKTKDELQALSIMVERIDPIHAEFKPQILGFLRDLKAEVGEEKMIAMMDRYTRSPGAPRTYNAYCEMVPQMTADEKAILWERMVQAREDCMAAWSGNQVIKIFKKYKIRNEFSLDYFGYGYRKHYKAWIKAKG